MNAPPINIPLLHAMVAEKLVSVEKHPEADIFIYNYTKRVQYDKLWNEVTLQTRGLIMDAGGNILARPFGKFFNLEELSPSELPLLPFDVFEKLDGSLGILYFLNGKPRIATRGSFVSSQAERATEILHERYSHVIPHLKEDINYLFEIILPENRIVVDYGDMSDIVLLTMIDTQSGTERCEDIGFPIVRRYDGIVNLALLREQEEANKEGFVVRFQNNVRVKVKFREYVRLHRIVTRVSNVVVWEYLRDGRQFDELIERVPDEFFTWLTATKASLEQEFAAIASHANEVFATIYSSDRKTFALRVMAEHRDISGILFCLYSKQTIDAAIWKMIRPTYSGAFRMEEDG